MKKMLLAALVSVCVCVCATFGAEHDKALYDAIMIVESGGCDTAVGDNGKAVGAFQIWKIYVDDVNRISGNNYTYEDRWNRQRSLEMVQIYVEHYSRRYERITGLRATREIKSRIHNGGPNGWKKNATKKYWEKVKKVLDR